MRDRCGCCGVPVAPDLRGRCLLCGYCDRVHGDELQERVAQAVAAGVCAPYLGLAIMATDDAHISGLLAILPFNPDGTRKPHGADLEITRTPRRWEVYASRALALRVTPDIGGLVQAALLPYLRLPNTAAVRRDLQREILAAIVFVDPDVVRVDIEIERDHVKHDEIRIEITKRGPHEPGAVLFNGGEEITAEVYGRKPASA